MKKGYIYAIEGIIAGLLIVFYLGNMVRPPERTGWDQTMLNHYSSDLMGALSRSGTMEDMINAGNMDRFPVVVSTVGGRVSSRISIDGIPKNMIEAGVVRTGEDVLIAHSDQSEIEGVGFELSSDEVETGYGSVEFEFSEVIDNSVDLDNYPVEAGSLRVGDVFVGCFGEDNIDVRDCDGMYQVGHLNNSIVVYDLSDLKKLVAVNQFESGGMVLHTGFRGIGVEEEVKEFSVGDVELYGDVETTYSINNIDEANGVFVLYEETYGERSYVEGDYFNMYDMTFEVLSVEDDKVELQYITDIDFDSLILKDEGLEFIQDRSEVFGNYVSDGNLLIQIDDFDQDFEDEGFQNRLGLWKENFEVDDKHIPQNVMVEDPGGPAGYMKDFFDSGSFVVSSERFYDEEAELNFDGETIIIERGSNYIDIDGDTYEPGDSLRLGRNRFELVKTEPNVVFRSTGSYIFANYFTGEQIHGDKNILEVDRWEYDFSDQHIEASTSTTTKDIEEYGLPETDCSNGHREGSFNLNGDDIEFVITPLEIGAGTNCDRFDLINFDFEGNGNFDDGSEETPVGFSGDGPHTVGSTIEMAGRDYWIRVDDDEEELLLNMVDDRSVPSAVWNSQAYKGSGNMFYIGDRNVDDEFAALLRSVIIKSSIRENRIVGTDYFGSPNIANMFTDSVTNEFYLPATLDTVWWFR